MSLPPFIVLNDVYKTYVTSNLTVKALQGVSFSLHRGEIFGLLGVNGAGKTTLSSILASLHPATSGAITWSGISIYDDLFAYRRILGYCPQKPNFEPTLTVHEHLMFAGHYYLMDASAIAARVEELLATFSLEPYAQSSPAIMSGGYRQRLLLARALVHRPQLLILDEPTVALDPQIRLQMWQIIKELKTQGVTVLLTTHYLDEAEHLSDRVCMLQQGRVVALDTPVELMKRYEQDTLEQVFLTVSGG